ncbi:MAG: hypothetical protein MR038_01850, partial [Oscillospiraceae bacterium]|nr:hypothetical protein [Oscillospiraceae bacterium]
PCRPLAAAKADVNQGVRHKSLICAAENPVLQDFQPITALRAVIEYALYYRIGKHLSIYKLIFLIINAMCSDFWLSLTVIMIIFVLFVIIHELY